jgi:adenosylhomocysteine nucleosidase
MENMPGGQKTSALKAKGRKTAIIAALHDEIAPLVRRWSWREIEYDSRKYRLFENASGGNCRFALICSGIGGEHGRRAAEALIRETRPKKILSVGFAGGLDATMKVGDIFKPRFVVNAADGSRTDTGSGLGTLVSALEVSGRDQKLQLARSYSASAVDMEGAHVAIAAAAHGIEFDALKSISDELDFPLPPINRFVSSDGTLRRIPFAAHVATRPQLWKPTILLAANSRKASRILCAAIERYLESDTVAGLN